MNSRGQLLRLDCLESRLVPATMVDAKTMTFQDMAGNTATVALNRPVLTAANVDSVFSFDTGAVNGNNNDKQQLETITLTGLIGGLALSVTGKDANGNAATVDVGVIDATGVDEKSIFVSGDIWRVTAGDINPKTPGLGKLIVGSVGVAAAGGAQPGELNTEITGALGKLTVAGDIQRAYVFVAGRIGPIQIGGSLTAAAVADSGRIQAEGSIGPVNIGENVMGAAAPRTGTIFAGDRMGPVTIGGNLAGDSGAFSGTIFATAISRLTVGGNVAGGDGPNSGNVSTAKIGKVTVGGDLIGGVGVSSGSLVFDRSGAIEVRGNVTGGDGANSAAITATRISNLKVGGGLIGGKGDFSAEIRADNISSITFGGSLTGGTGRESGCIVAAHNIGRVTVGGNWTGASIVAGFSSGQDGFFGTADDGALTDAKGKPILGKIASITIAGTIDGTAVDGDNFAFEASKIGSLTFNGQKVALKAGPKSDNMPLGTHLDFALIEK